MSVLRSIGIIGTGLIGGSIGLRARSKGLQVVGFDRHSGAAARALELGCIEREMPREQLYRECDLVVLSMPARAVVEELRRLQAENVGLGIAILDVASVKAPVAEAARGIDAFVGTHPMAGNEGSGPSAADAALFEGRTWAYVPAQDPAATERALELIALMGAKPISIDPNAHDSIVALTSHAPQIFAAIFAERLRELDDPTASALCGPVARELLRIGSAMPDFWNDVLAMNAKNIGAEARILAEALQLYFSNGAP